MAIDPVKYREALLSASSRLEWIIKGLRPDHPGREHLEPLLRRKQREIAAIDKYLGNTGPPGDVR